MQVASETSNRRIITGEKYLLENHSSPIPYDCPYACICPVMYEMQKNEANPPNIMRIHPSRVRDIVGISSLN
jgi:hypothetical protein